MALKEQVENYLKEQPRFRERKDKDMGIVNLLMRRHHKLGDAVAKGVFDKSFIVMLVQEYASMDRAWRQALERNEELRGKDYDDKHDLEHKKQRELGYRVAPDQP